MTVRVTGDRETAASLRAVGRAVERRTRRSVYRAGAFLQTAVRRNASTGYHRPGAGHLPGTGPGPNVATGDYRRTITVTNASTATLATSTVWTNAPQAPRLEHGFVGADSRGRVYHQPAYPHWAPAIPATEAFLAAELAADLAAADAESQGMASGAVGHTLFGVEIR